MSTGCIVKNCPGNIKTGEEQVSFHDLPIDNEQLLRKWLEKVHFKSSPTENSKICSLHFDQSSFKISGTDILLVDNAVPYEYNVSN
jgi:THAP domain